MDNFSRHNIDYKPTNIQIEFFEPNLTAFVQPLDAGIIRCFKAHYRNNFCRRAIDLDEAGEKEIYKINLREGMMMADEAWKAVTAETISHCWDHTKIRDEPSNSTVTGPYSDPGAWDILRHFASSDMTLPQAEAKLQEHLGDCYKDSDWYPALKAVMDTEGDITRAQEAIKTFSSTCEQPKLTIKLPASRPPQITAIEKDLIESVEELKARKRISDPLPSIDIINPAGELEETLKDSPYAFPGGDREIVDKVRHEIQVQTGQVIEIDDEDSEDDEDPDESVSRRNTINLVAQLERLSIKYGGSSDTTLELTHHLRKFRGYLHREESQNAKQTSIKSFFSVPLS